jgi:hypothetical protein
MATVNLSEKICTCGHPQSLHRTYGCIASSHSSPKDDKRSFCKCKSYTPAKTTERRTG